MPKRLSPEKKDLMLQLRSEGKSFRQINSLTGIAKSTLSYNLTEGQKEKTMKRGRKYREEMRQFINRYKEERGCQDCRDEGYPGMHPYYVLDADHVRGEKKSELSRMNRTHSREEILEELAKCDIVCANHHRVRTHNRRMIKLEIKAGREGAEN
jgi:hypothetical protein